MRTMSKVLEKARALYYAEGIDSLIIPFDGIGIDRIQAYIEKARKELENVQGTSNVIRASFPRKG